MDLLPKPKDPEQAYMDEMKVAEKKQQAYMEQERYEQQAMQQYLERPQNETQFDWMYVEPGAPGREFKEWTRDSILSNYGPVTQKVIRHCVNQLRICEMMEADARLRGDNELIKEFIEPIRFFCESEKAALENTSRNIDGFNSKMSKARLSMIDQHRTTDDVTGQGGRQKSFMDGMRLPKPAAFQG